MRWDVAGSETSALPSRGIGVVAGGAVLAFHLSWIVVGMTTTGYSARKEFISALASTSASMPGVMIGAFVLLGVGLIAAGLVAAATRSPVSLLIGGVLALSGIAIAVSGCLQQRCSTAISACADHTTTAHGTIASVGLSLLLVAALASSILARRWVAIGLA